MDGEAREGERAGKIMSQQDKRIAPERELASLSPLNSQLSSWLHQLVRRKFRSRRVGIPACACVE